MGARRHAWEPQSRTIRAQEMPGAAVEPGQIRDVKLRPGCSSQELEPRLARNIELYVLRLARGDGHDDDVRTGGATVPCNPGEREVVAARRHAGDVHAAHRRDGPGRTVIQREAVPVRVDDGPPRAIAAVGSVDITGVPPGSH